MWRKQITVFDKDKQANIHIFLKQNDIKSIEGKGKKTTH